MKELPSDPLLDFILQVFHQPQKVDAVYHYLLARDSVRVIHNLPVEREYYQVRDHFDEKTFSEAVSNRARTLYEAERDLKVATTKMERQGIPSHVVDTLSLNYVVFPDMINEFRNSSTVEKTPRERYMEKRKSESLFSVATDWIKSFKRPKRSR